MTFDPCPEKITKLILRAGAIIRELKGLPKETNITTLYNETAPLLGILIRPMSSKEVNHLPEPFEVKDDRGKFVVPRRDCPICGSKETVILAPLCQSCKDAEGGKYKSAWLCQSPSCTGFKERSEKAFLKWLEEFQIEIPYGPKATLGIKTITDDGLK